jgi:flavin-dependent dehydrogenase
MDAWDKVEAAGFPIKVGGRYRWGSSEDTWPLDFVPDSQLRGVIRPAGYEGVRRMTAFQVDRSVYDQILLEHATSMGCEVHMGAPVASVGRDGDRITGLTLKDGRELTARYYVDASGDSGLLRRKMEIGTVSPSSLRNVAIWDYWQNAEWAEHIGVGGTRILVMSVGWGWLWFIPLGPTRTSIGLVTPAEYVKRSGKRPQELYAEAIAEEPTISKLVQSATCESLLQTTRDWSFVAERLHGENWFLAGDAAGFADPILSAGLTLAQAGARKIAYTILELERGEQDPAWLKGEYDRAQSAQIRSHIRFADYWYSANGHFDQLKEYCSEIARDSGVHLEPELAFRWLGSGGFAADSLNEPHLGMFTIPALKLHIQEMTGNHAPWLVEGANVFDLDTAGAEQRDIGVYQDGRIERVSCLIRGANFLPDYRLFGAMRAALEKERELPFVLERFGLEAGSRGAGGPGFNYVWVGVQLLEALLGEGWVKGSLDAKERLLRIVLKRDFLTLGWYEEGVGLRSAYPGARGRVECPWDKYLEARGLAA